MLRASMRCGVYVALVALAATGQPLLQWQHLACAAVAEGVVLGAELAWLALKHRAVSSGPDEPPLDFAVAAVLWCAGGLLVGALGGFIGVFALPVVVPALLVQLAALAVVRAFAKCIRR